MNAFALKGIQCLTVFISTFLVSFSCHAEVIKVGLAEAPPLAFEKKSPLLGIYKEIFAEISKLTADTFIFEQGTSAQIQDDFRDDTIDIEPGINPVWRSEEPTPGVYTIPFGKSTTILMTFTSEKNTEVSSKKPLKTAVVEGYRYPDLEDKFKKGIWIAVPAPNERTLFTLLSKKKVDQALIQHSVARYLLKNGKIRKANQYQLSKPVQTQDVMLRVNPDKAYLIPRLNKAIKTLVDNGTIKKIYHQYALEEQ